MKINNQISLLDCTLRDGGYINNWDFGLKSIKRIISRLCDSNIDYVEVGFLRNCQYDSDKVLFTNVSEIESIIPSNKGNTKFVAMALHNLYNIEQLDPYDGKSVDIIRVTFHDYDIDEGLEFIKRVMAKGYRCFCNPINIMGYSDKQILMLIDKINKIQPYGFSIVDTFGSMLKSDLIHLYHLIEHNLDKSIVIGLHLHENLASSFPLAQDFVCMLSPGRECVVDASLHGMGRMPGNLCLELFMDYMNKEFNHNYKLNPIYDVIDDNIMIYKNKEPWGYNIAYAISAKYNLHRNYAEYLICKGKLRAKDINFMLAKITMDKKTVFDESYIADIYNSYLSVAIDDNDCKKELATISGAREILIISPGTSIIDSKESIDVHIKEKNPLTIAANFTGDGLYSPDYYFFSNLKRYESFITQIDNEKCLTTSNVIHSSISPRLKFNYSDFAFSEKFGYFDNCVLMLLRLLISIGIRKVCIAGFDGYKDNSDNYADKNMAIVHSRSEESNILIKKHLDEIKDKIEIVFLTPSEYL